MSEGLNQSNDTRSPRCRNAWSQNVVSTCGVSRCIPSSHVASHLDVSGVLLHVCDTCLTTYVQHVSPCMRTEACGLTHSHSGGAILLVEAFINTSILPSVSFIFLTPKSLQNVDRERENRFFTEKPSSVQSKIFCDCYAEALPKSIRPRKSYSFMIKWSSVVVLKLDTPLKVRRTVQKLKKVMLELSSVQTSIRRDSVQFKISPDLSIQVVHWFLAKSSLINQPLIGIEHCELPPVSPIEDRGTTIPIEDRDRVIPECLRLCGVIVKGLPVSIVWRKNDFVALDKDDRIAWCWTLGTPV
ncbi:hypothetical protein IGI04_014008 [Brassica rapa subsp. trilocularis]|uniref:Uncharacterized protein n=1 Tax=Brassica rapa subsp. trilocularis TaxID=1813537 RepID=A0ABQ7NAG6_BRACM|nr:hypothetical protein IGI04_014008 [Brassica rapa subsp. trilocularis]